MSIWASTPGAEELTSPRLIRDAASTSNAFPTGRNQAENSSTPFADRIALKTSRGRPCGFSAARIRTLLSRTIRSAFIRQERIQRGVRQAFGGCFPAQAAHSFSQLFPGRPTKPLVVLHRHHDDHRSTVPGDSHRRTLSGIEQTAEAVPGISGGGLSHVATVAFFHNAYVGSCLAPVDQHG